MKAIIQKLGIVFITFFFLASCNVQFEKLPEELISKEKIIKAEKFAKEFLESLSSGTIYEFTNEAIEELILQLTPELQKKVYSQVESKFGKFKSLEYVETWIKNDTKELKIVRFKGYFELSKNPLEIRVVIDESDKIAGFWIKPWKDDLN